MSKLKRARRVGYSVLELDGAAYAVLRESVLREICRLAGVAGERRGAAADSQVESVAAAAGEGDAERLAERLVARRRASGLSQAELARRAGVRIETLNRIERGHTTPEFKTIRKLVAALAATDKDRTAAALRASRARED